MKGCFKTSQAGFKALLRRQKVIDEYLNILPDQLGRFRALVSTWTKYAETQYGVSERLFFDDGFKAIPNEQAFHIIDFKKGVKYPENEWVGTDVREPIEKDLVKEYRQTMLSLEDYLIDNQIVIKIC